MSEHILIRYNEHEEMMEISRDGVVAFYGNYWDFDADPSGIFKVLKKLGLEVVKEETLEEIG